MLEFERDPVRAPVPVGGSAAGSAAPAPGPALSLDSAPLASVIDLVRRGVALTRPELVDRSGLTRRVVSQRVEQAVELGLLEEDGFAPSGGGRQARTLRFPTGAGVVLVATIGASEMYAGVSDLGGTLLETVHEDWSVQTEPGATLSRLIELLDGLLQRVGRPRPWAVSVGVPGPVDFASGRVVAPQIMPGWDGYGVRARLREHFDGPVWVDNDANLMALGESRSGHPADGRDLLFVKVGTGVGSGYLVGGRLVRGDNGAAGDIGHVRVPGAEADEVVCRCGRRGCLEAVAGGRSLLDEVTRRADESPLLAGVLAHRGRLVLGDVAEAVGRGDALARALVDRRARIIGEVLANVVNFCNPGSLVVGGGVLRTGPRFLEVVREVLRERCTDLVTRDLVVRGASLEQAEGLHGAAWAALDNLLGLAPLSHWVLDGSPLGHATSLQRLAPR